MAMAMVILMETVRPTQMQMERALTGMERGKLMMLMEMQRVMVMASGRTMQKQRGMAMVTVTQRGMAIVTVTERPMQMQRRMAMVTVTERPMQMQRGMAMTTVIQRVTVTLRGTPMPMQVNSLMEMEIPRRMERGKAPSCKWFAGIPPFFDTEHWKHRHLHNTCLQCSDFPLPLPNRAYIARHQHLLTLAPCSHQSYSRGWD